MGAIAKRHSRHARLLGAALVAAGSVVGASVLIANASIPPALRVLLALAPAVPLGWLIFLELAWIRRCDELQRRIFLESLAIAFPASFIVFQTVELLQDTHVFPPWVSVAEFWPGMVFLWVVAYWASRRRYR